MRFRIMTLVLLATLGLTLACANRTVKFARLVPPEDPAMLGVETVVLGDFAGVRGHEDLEDDMRTTILDDGYFHLLASHDEMEGLMTEVEVGGIDPDWEASQAVINGRLVQHTFRERVVKGKSYTDDNGVRHIPHERIATARVAARFTIAEVRSREYLSTIQIEKVAEAKTKKVDGPPEKVHPDRLLAQARAMVVQEFLRRTAPHTVYESVQFKKPKDVELPELDTAIKLLRGQSNYQALRLFESMAVNYPYHPETAYNLGLALALNARYEEAMDAFDRAIEVDPGGKLTGAISTGQAKCRRWQREAQTLAEADVR